MAGPKITLVGGCSGAGVTLAGTVAQHPELRGAHLHYFDINESGLKTLLDVARLVNDYHNFDLVITGGCDRREALEDSDFLFFSFAVDRLQLWYDMLHIALKHGVQQVEGLDYGTGGFLATLCNAPIAIDICADAEKYCSNAIVLIRTSPPSRIVMAVSLYSNMKAVGLCHNPWEVNLTLMDKLNMKEDEFEVQLAGLNHCWWIMKMTAKDGRDLYPEFRRNVLAKDPHRTSLETQLMDVFGFYPYVSGPHMSESLAWGWRYHGMHTGEERMKKVELRKQEWHDLEKMATASSLDVGNETAQKCVGGHPSSQMAIKPIAHMIANRGERIPAVDLKNDGFITNLPDDAAVGVPATADRNGIHGQKIGDLPTGIASLIQLQYGTQRLAVEAAATRSRTLAIQALTLDPHVRDMETARRILDDIYAWHGDRLPKLE